MRVRETRRDVQMNGGMYHPSIQHRVIEIEDNTPLTEGQEVVPDDTPLCDWVEE